MTFDCHVHLPSPGAGTTWEWQPCTPDTAAAVRYLRRCGVDRALANSMRGEVARTPEEMVAGNDEAMAAARDYPDLFVPACLVNTSFAAEAQDEIRRCHEAGMVWIGELCGYAGGYTYDTEAFAQAAALASDLDMVVQIHDERADDMERLCREFPRVEWVLAHLGDSPRQCTERCETAARNPNLYLDICGHGYQRMGILELAVRCAGPDRVLFGSDYTINDPAGVIVRVQRADFDDDTKARILGGNVVRMLTARGWRASQ
jgi:predicted TIM-barrel fold metal-dependent hydrolase